MKYWLYFLGIGYIFIGINQFFKVDDLMKPVALIFVLIGFGFAVMGFLSEIEERKNDDKNQRR